MHISTTKLNEIAEKIKFFGKIMGLSCTIIELCTLKNRKVSRFLSFVGHIKTSCILRLVICTRSCCYNYLRYLPIEKRFCNCFMPLSISSRVGCFLVITVVLTCGCGANTVRL